MKSFEDASQPIDFFIINALFYLFIKNARQSVNTTFSRIDDNDFACTIRNFSSK